MENSYFWLPMESLHALIKSHDKKEIKKLFRYISVFGGRKELEQKTNKLLKIIVRAKGEAPSSSTCSKKIYGHYQPDSFRKLKRHLRNLVYESLLCNSGNHNIRFLDETDDAVIRIKKKSALYTQLRYSKPSSPLLNRLLDEIIQQCEEYEYY